MRGRDRIYWYCQILGWSFYIFINTVFFGLKYQSATREYLLYFLMLPAGVGISHVYRLIILRARVLEKAIPIQLVIITLASFLNGAVFFLVTLAFSRMLILPVGELSLLDVTGSVINFAVIFSLWNLIYFGFHYFQNYKRSEITALRHLADSREHELRSLKAQLNPHFLFNCMNSIRALIDESPTNAKAAVTRLSNILRTSLLMDKSKEIDLQEEISLVRDYLELEKIRYEERMSYTLELENDCLRCPVPPFIVQAQVENAIKHGLSKLPGKGHIQVDAARNNGNLRIRVSNTGTIEPGIPDTGIGLQNSRHRLELLYGPQATIELRQKGDCVEVEIAIPLADKL